MPQHQQSIRFSLRRLLAVVVVVAAAGAIYVATVGRSQISTLFGNAENIAIVRDATRVEAYRVTLPGGDAPNEDTSPLDYEITSDPVRLPTAMASELAKTLLSSDTYSGAAAACGPPIYGVKISFFRNAERVDVYFCFHCSVLRVVRDERVYGGADFGNAEQVFVKAVKTLFPNDVEIQAIRE